MLLETLNRLGVVHCHLHSLLGLPSGFDATELFASLSCRYDVTIHDYHLVCPRVHLQNGNGSHCGEPDAAGCGQCLRNHGDYWGRSVDPDIGSWRAASAKLLAEARRVFVPSADVARRMKRYFPAVRFLLRPHCENLPSQSPSRSHAPGEPVRVVLLGCLLPIKGLDQAVACARDARRRQLPLSFHVVGPAPFRNNDLTEAGVTVSGEYRDSEVFDRLAEVQAHCAWFPSAVPETYGYTLSVALSAGLYCVGNDLGAIGERIRLSGRGEVLAPGMTPEQVNACLLAVPTRLERLALLPAVAFKEYPEFLRDYYGLQSASFSRCWGDPRMAG